ncbi:MAG TPA: hypothetical protein VMB46_04780 [Methanomassiliicoccales archaeon]|nr:hypothetical protein [Methanomassiliicoccales archaeon]
MTYSNVEKTETGFAIAVKEGKKTKKSEGHLSLSESFRRTDERFRAIRPIVRR